MSTPLISISIIDKELKLLKIDQRRVSACMWAVVRSLFLQDTSEPDQFYSVTLNDVELSIFGEASLVEQTHAMLGEGEISDTTWIALQVEQHDDWQDAGIRVREISAPLAAEGISILFQSTYISDFILLKKRRLRQGIQILEKTTGFVFQASSPVQENSLSVSQPRGGRSSSFGTSDSLPKSITGSLTLTDGPASPFLKRRTSLSSTKSSPRMSGLSLSRDVSQSPLPHSSLGLEGFPASPSESTAEAPPAEPRSFEEINSQSSMSNSMHSEASSQQSINLASKLSLLPDELVCIGLNPEYNYVWREKLIRAFFYPDDVLPPSHPNDNDQVPPPSQDRHNRTKRSPVASFADETSDTDNKPPEGPLPFLSFTCTTDGCSLTADIRLLRTLFANDEHMVYTVGASLNDPWDGEGDPQDLLGTTPMPTQRGRTRYREDDTENTWDPEPGGEPSSGRQLMKCLQLDLTSFGLDKTGIVGLVTELLTSKGVNLLYCSTFGTANVLVQKCDLFKARLALEGNLTI